MNLTVIEPKAAPGYTDYIVQQHHIIAAGIGVPYESMTGDMTKVTAIVNGPAKLHLAERTAQFLVAMGAFPIAENDNWATA